MNIIHATFVTSLHGVSVQIGKWNNHDIPNVIYISMDITGSAGVSDILRDVTRLGMRILYIYREGYRNQPGARNSWLMGTPEAITMFSLKHKKYIKASMDQKTMNKAMEFLEKVLFQEPEYHLNYQISLHRLATGQSLILEPSNFKRWEKRGRRDVIIKLSDIKL